MRVALLSWECLNAMAVGGVAVHVSELAFSLARKGHDVHLFSRMAPGKAHYEYIDGVHHHFCPFDLNPHFITEIDNMCASFAQAVYDTEDFGGAFDIVHAHDWLTVPALVKIKHDRRRKTILTLHSTEYGRCGNTLPGGDSEHIRHLEWLGMYEADHVIAVSNVLKKEAGWLYDVPMDRVRVIYNGIKCDRYDGWIDAQAVRKMHEIGPDDPVVLFVGRMAWQKGPDILLDAVPHILRSDDRAKIIFGGDGSMRADMESAVHRMGVKSSTRFLGHIGGWQLMDLYKTADCICVPSRNEPFGIVILEAWAAGKPVVASINGGPSEFVWDNVNGYKVEADAGAIHNRVGPLLADSEHAQWMGRNGRMSAETIFSWDTIADETVQMYNN